MRYIKAIVSLLCIALLVSFCSCIEEESAETLKMPAIGSMIEYRISDTEYLKILYNDYYSNYGEWIKDEEVIKLYVSTDEDYWGLFATRYGIAKLNIAIRELTLEDHEFETGELLATTDEGFLNSTTLTLAQTGEVIRITKIDVAENYDGNFDWATPEWKEFRTPMENHFYEIEKLSVKFDSVTREGEWFTNDIIIPVKLVFDDWFCSVEIYDISVEQHKRIFSGNGHIEDGILIIDEATRSDMFYGNSVTEIKLIKTTAP